MKKIVFFLVLLNVCYGQDSRHIWKYENEKITWQFCNKQGCNKKEVYEKEELLYCLNSRFQMELNIRRDILKDEKKDYKVKELKKDIAFFDKTKKELAEWINLGIKNNFKDDKLMSWLRVVRTGVPFLRKKRKKATLKKESH